MNNKKQKALLLFFGLILSFFVIELSLRIAGYIVNSKEIRKHNLSMYSPEAPLKILCLGDSFTFGLGTGYDYSYPRQLERILKKNNPQKEIAVYNRGIPGQNSSEVLKSLDKNFREINPDILIVMVGINNDPYLRYSNYWLFADIRDIGFRRYILRKLDYYLSYLRSCELAKSLILNLKNKVALSIIENNYPESSQEVVKDKSMVGMDGNRDSKEVQKYLNFGKTYFAERKFELAIQQAKRALSLSPVSERAHLLLAGAYREKEEYNLAKLEIDKALDINSDNCRVYLEFGNVYYRQGRNRPDIKEENFKLAVESLRRAIELNPRVIEAHLILAGVYSESGRRDLAEETAKKILTIYPTNVELKRLVGGYLSSTVFAEQKIFDKVVKYDLENIIRLAKAKGIKVILMNYPDVNCRNDIRICVAKRYSIAYIDILSKFKKLLERCSYKDLFSDDATHSRKICYSDIEG
ncbi:MAG: tetratricopeptide repeat protein [Candidatus Omnitrophica bacterium]|nr:tetratricopeptide repeat protein [Candidatus Omnitrophota bacterium]